MRMYAAERGKSTPGKNRQGGEGVEKWVLFVAILYGQSQGYVQCTRRIYLLKRSAERIAHQWSVS